MAIQAACFVLLVAILSTAVPLYVYLFYHLCWNSTNDHIALGKTLRYHATSSDHCMRSKRDTW